ncbi:MAG TPA: hypothetical protein VI548_01175 [Chitinophagaceae bacterium]|nr:hypothetical protein [Chitinophagaceae bacterium]
MYELVKKKNVLFRIISGLVILFLLTSILKLFTNEPKLSINEELVLISNEINKHTPLIVDSTLRLDNVLALPENRLHYNYTITYSDNIEIDTTILINNTKQNIINKIKSNPKAAYFRDNKINIVVTYSDKNGVYLCNFNVSHKDY